MCVLFPRVFIYLIPTVWCHLNLSREKAVFPYSMHHSSYLRLALVALYVLGTVILLALTYACLYVYVCVCVFVCVHIVTTLVLLGKISNERDIPLNSRQDEFFVVQQFTRLA